MARTHSRSSEALAGWRRYLVVQLHVSAFRQAQTSSSTRQSIRDKSSYAPSVDLIWLYVSNTPAVVRTEAMYSSNRASAVSPDICSRSASVRCGRRPDPQANCQLSVPSAGIAWRSVAPTEPLLVQPASPASPPTPFGTRRPNSNPVSRSPIFRYSEFRSVADRLNFAALCFSYLCSSLVQL